MTSVSGQRSGSNARQVGRRAAIDDQLGDDRAAVAGARVSPYMPWPPAITTFAKRRVPPDQRETVGAHRARARPTAVAALSQSRSRNGRIDRRMASTRRASNGGASPANSIVPPSRMRSANGVATACTSSTMTGWPSRASSGGRRCSPDRRPPRAAGRAAGRGRGFPRRRRAPPRRPQRLPRPCGPARRDRRSRRSR